MPAGAALAATTLWLEPIVAASLERPAALLDIVVTGPGHHSRLPGESEVKDALSSFLLEELGGPFRLQEATRVDWRRTRPLCVHGWPPWGCG